MSERPMMDGTAAYRDERDELLELEQCNRNQAETIGALRRQLNDAIDERKEWRKRARRAEAIAAARLRMSAVELADDGDGAVLMVHLRRD